MAAFRRTNRVARRAFSIVEMMIALVVLGLGLLFIAAAIPAGLSYAVQTTDLATAESVADYAFAELAGSLRLTQVEPDPQIYTGSDDAATYNERTRRETIFRPRRERASATRFQTTDVYFEADLSFEPLIKLRPVVMANVSIAPNRGDAVVDSTETTIEAYLAENWGALVGSTEAALLQVDLSPSFVPVPGGVNWALMANPAVSSLARVYPEPRLRTPLSTDAFLTGQTGQSTYRAYTDRDGLGLLDFGAFPEERLQVLDRRYGWTAFYRRMQYADPGPWQSGSWGFGDGDDRPGDDALYEVIVVVTRRPSAAHRFPMQDWDAANATSEPTAVAPGNVGGGINAVIGADRVAPTPWLVTFDSLPELTLNTDYVFVSAGAAASAEPAVAEHTRVLRPSFPGAAAPTMTFTCSAAVGRLLPAGAVFFPAVNDDWPGSSVIPAPPTPRAVFQPRVGFVPNTTDIPIYTVVETTFDDDEATVLVENNGVFPWINPNIGSLGPEHWPVWVIPPAFEQRADGQPLFEDKS
ncbi:MAG: prepilin-type N-terminal cleavage/methylation domain-containing protein, partial [Phycisphaerales bacterium]|nr:prepilin-type N-terminal cleavage/methylation domain-containing protein [Phycisphaerales bacterium]